MIKISDDSKLDKSVLSLSNIYYDTFNEVANHYKDSDDMDIWEESCTISLRGTAANIGLFDKSDIIAVYDLETHLPVIITERIYKKNYSKFEWRKMKKYMQHKIRIVKHELGFNIRVAYNKDYIDYIHYKEEWWQWALKQSKNVKR